MNAIATASGGIGIGTILAMYLSYKRWRSVGWVLVHGFFGWFYVVYFVLTRDRFAVSH